VLALAFACCNECDKQAFASTDYIDERQYAVASTPLPLRIAAQRRDMDELHEGMALGRPFQSAPIDVVAQIPSGIA